MSASSVGMSQPFLSHDPRVSEIAPIFAESPDSSQFAEHYFMITGRPILGVDMQLC
jgi:hypothetical protein